MPIRTEDLERVAKDMLAVLEVSESFCGFLADADTLQVRWFESYHDCRSIDEIRLQRKDKDRGQA